MSTTEIHGQDPGRRAEPALLVSDRVEIRDVVLVAAEMIRRHVDQGKSLNVHVQSSTRAAPESSSGLLRVRAELSFAARETDGEKNTAPIEVHATYELTYVIPDQSGLTQEDFDAFAQTNGVFNAWPYFREFLQSSLTRMGLPPFTIPVFRIGRSARPAQAGESASQERKT